MDETERLWTEKQLADYLNVSVKSVQRWRAAGAGPPVEWAGARPRYRKSAVDEWLRRGGPDQAEQHGGGS